VLEDGVVGAAVRSKRFQIHGEFSLSNASLASAAVGPDKTGKVSANQRGCRASATAGVALRAEYGREEAIAAVLDKHHRNRGATIPASGGRAGCTCFCLLPTLTIVFIAPIANDFGLAAVRAGQLGHGKVVAHFNR
jgi:hypothetical protein